MYCRPTGLRYIDDLDVIYDCLLRPSVRPYSLTDMDEIKLYVRSTDRDGERELDG